MKIVVCDTGPILHLREADYLPLLAAAGTIYTPPMADAEMVRLDSGWADERPAWVHVLPYTPRSIPSPSSAAPASASRVGRMVEAMLG